MMQCPASDVIVQGNMPTSLVWHGTSMQMAQRTHHAEPEVLCGFAVPMTSES